MLYKLCNFQVQHKAWDVVYRSYASTSAVLHCDKMVVEYCSLCAESLCLTLQDNNGKEIALSRD